MDNLGRKQPIAETIVSKNKLNCKTGFKGRLYWKFVPYIGYMQLIGDEKTYATFKRENHQGEHREVTSVIESSTPPEIVVPLIPKTFDPVNLDPDQQNVKGVYSLGQI